MSRRDLLAAYDGISIINGGMDSGNAPVTIGRSKVSFAKNVAFRRGQAATRPGWRRRPLLFPDEATRALFEEHLFQGASPYSLYDGGAKLVVQIGGRTFRIEADEDYSVSDLSLTGNLNPSTRPKSWFAQAEDFLVIQDGQSAALIYDGTTLRRVDPSSYPDEVPVGTVMEYSMGRLWVTLPSGRSFMAGDLAYSDSGTAAYNHRDAVIKFTENDFLNEGGEFGVPADVGVITSMRAIAVLDTSLGQGPLQVMAERGIFSVDAPFDRTEWKNLERPIQTVSLMGNGSRSHEAAIGINGDLWFRSSDGIRSFQVARRDFGAWVNTPLSTEMGVILDLDDTTLLQHASAAIFDNRYLLTSSPARVPGHGVIWRGITALDFDNVSGLTSRSVPAYDGFWTGLDILQVVPLEDRCFFFVLNNAAQIELWEQTKLDEFDNQGSPTPTRISCFLDTPAFDFADKGWDRKLISTADLWVRDLAGTVDFNVEWRPDDHECWTQWHGWSVDSKRTTCLDECGFPLSLKPQYRPRMRLPLPPDDCNDKANMPLRHGFHHQLRLAWTGRARITKLRLTAHEWQEESAPHCEQSEGEDLTGVSCCDTSLFNYRAVYVSTAQSVQCTGADPLTSSVTLPARLSISGSTLTVDEGSFTGITQADADAAALAYVSDYLATGLANETLNCGTFTSTEQTVSCPDADALIATGALPAGVTTSGISLVLAAGHDTSPTSQAASDTLALTYLQGVFDDGIVSGLLVCVDFGEDLVSWWKADILLDPLINLQDGDPVALWPDNSVGNRDLIWDTASNPNTKPTFRTNIFGSMPAVHFDTATYAEQYLICSPDTAFTDYTVLAVVKQTATNDGGLMGWTSGNKQIRLNRGHPLFVPPRNSTYDGVTETLSSSTGPVNDLKMVGFTRASIFGVYTMSFYENLASIGSGIVTTQAHNMNKMGRFSTGNNFDGYIAEVLIFDVRLPHAQIMDYYTNYFKPRWGLP